MESLRDKMKMIDRFNPIIESLLQALLKDLINGIEQQEAGWRPPIDFRIEPSDQCELLRRGIIERNATGQFRFNFRNHRARQELKAFDAQFEQIDCFLEDIKKFKRVQKILCQVAEISCESPENWGYIIALGWWKMLESSQMSAGVKDLFEEGFSPRDWAVAAIQSSAQFVLEVAGKYGKIETLGIGVKFFEKRGLLRKDSIILPPPVTRDTVKKVKKIIRWEDIQMNLTESNIKVLAFFWLLFLILENNRSLPRSTEYSLKTNKTIWGSLEKLLERRRRGLLGELENSLKILTKKEIHWVLDLVRLPGII